MKALYLLLAALLAGGVALTHLEENDTQLAGCGCKKRKKDYISPIPDLENITKLS